MISGKAINLAVDGSVRQLPISNALPEHFGKVRSHGAMPHVRLSQLYDANLYHQRWDVEEGYKVLKSRLNIENYSSVSVEGVLQDLHAKLLTKNLAVSAIQDAKRKIKKPKKNRLYEYKINFTFAINQLKDNVVRFIMRLAELELYELLINKISKNLSVIRPESNFFRQDRRNKTN